MKKTYSNKNYKEHKSGFTIIEVSLVTAFMAMLMIAIATVTTGLSALYRKGITLKAVNSVGRNIVTELTNTINSAPAIDSASLCNTLIPSSRKDARQKCINDNANNYVYQSWEDETYDKATGTKGRVQYSGVLCTGNYSYVWNTFYGLDSGKAVTVAYYDAASAPRKTKEGFKLLRFKDKTYLACSTNVNSGYEFEGKREIDITHLENGTINIVNDFQDNYLSDPKENSNEDSNKNSDISLSLYELTLFPVSQDSVTLRAFFSGTFILATERGEVNIVRGGDYCNVDDFQEDTSSNLRDLGSEFNYCGINKFNFAARTAGNDI